MYHAFCVEAKNKNKNKQTHHISSSIYFNNNSLINIFARSALIYKYEFLYLDNSIWLLWLPFCCVWYFVFSCFWWTRFMHTFQMIGASISDLQQTIQGNLVPLFQPYIKYYERFITRAWHLIFVGSAHRKLNENASQTNEKNAATKNHIF